jgi:NAD(P)H-dependent FMN reductase
MKRILGISGSARKNSTNEIILQSIKNKFRERFELVICENLSHLPFFNPDNQETDHPSVSEFRRQINDADGILICTPEYVFSPPGILKNALEWTVSTTAFSSKPFALIVASALGEKTLESLDIIMSTLLQYKISDDAKLLISGSRSKIKTLDDIDQRTLESIEQVVNNLIKQIETKTA